MVIHQTIALFLLIMLHRADGKIISINPEHVVSVSPARDHGHFAPGIHCIIHTSDRKFYSVREACADVSRLFSKKG